MPIICVSTQCLTGSIVGQWGIARGAKEVLSNCYSTQCLTGSIWCQWGIVQGADGVLSICCSTQCLAGSIWGQWGIVQATHEVETRPFGSRLLGVEVLVVFAVDGVGMYRRGPQGKQPAVATFVALRRHLRGGGRRGVGRGSARVLGRRGGAPGRASPRVCQPSAWGEGLGDRDGRLSLERFRCAA